MGVAKEGVRRASASASATEICAGVGKASRPTVSVEIGDIVVVEEGAGVATSGFGVVAGVGARAAPPAGAGEAGELQTFGEHKFSILAAKTADSVGERKLFSTGVES